MVFALLALPESTPTALYGLFEVFTSVGVTWPELTGQETEEAAITARIMAAVGKPYISPIGLPIAPHGGLEDSDVIIVTDLALPPGFDPRGRWPLEVNWLQSRYRSGATICSVCTGSVLLAEAGLLSGEVATTHWSATDLFSRYYPDVRMTPERILVPAGQDDRIVTCGGASSWEELALYLIARFRSGAEAIRIAKIFLLGDRTDGQLQFSGVRRPRHHEDRIVASCQAWIADNYVLANPVARMVKRVGVPERTFKRRFKAATGYTALDYVQTLRIEEAKQLLETTDKATDSIAAEVGYEDPTFFRRLFKRRTGITPGRYRQKFSMITKLGARS